MPNRFDPRPLAGGVIRGLRKRRAVGREPADIRTRVVLLGAPIALGAFSIWVRWRLDGVELLVAGFSLLAAAMLAVFPQLAAWRDRLTERNRATEGVARSATDEAVAHVLSIALVSFVGAALSVALTNAGTYWLRVILSGVMSGVGLYVLLSAFITINLLWDAYARSAGIKLDKDRQREAA